MNSSFLHKFAIAIVLILSTALVGQTGLNSILQDISDSKASRRYRWFYEARAYPDLEVSLQSYLRAVKEAQEERRGLARSGARQAVAWQSIGPAGIAADPQHWGIVGGRVRGLAVHPTDPNTVYIGAASGGIWKSITGGAVWNNIGEILPSQTYGAIAIDPNDGEIVFAGTGEVRLGTTYRHYNGAGIYRSSNGGTDWQDVTNQIGIDTVAGDIAPTHVSRILVSPFNSDTVFAAIGEGYRHLRSLRNQGVWRSGNSGDSWTHILKITNAFDLQVSGTFSGTVFAAIGGGDDDSSGVWRSTNNGDTWTRKSNGLPVSTDIDRIQISLSEAAPATIFAVIYSRAGEPPGNLLLPETQAFKSTDNGENWQAISGALTFGDPGPPFRDQGYYDLFISAHPGNVNEIYLGNIEIFHTLNQTDWNPLRAGVTQGVWDSPMHVDYHNFAFAASDPAIRYAVNDGGVYRSDNNGATWQSRNAGLSTLQFYRLASSPHDPDHIVGGAQDNGISEGRFLSPGAPERAWTQISTGDGFECFFDPTHPTRLYISTQDLGLMRSDNGIDFISITSGIDADDEREFLAPFLMEPVNSQTLFAATTRVYRSNDRGDNWAAISGHVRAKSAPIRSMAISPGTPRFMILSVSDSVFISTTAGNNWSYQDWPDFPNRIVSRVVADPGNDSMMYAIFSGFDEPRKLFRTTNLGATWQDISGDLPDVPHNDLFVDPAVSNSSSMYIANDLGVYSSSDGGVAWQPEINGLPIVPVLDFDYSFAGRKLRIATFGRSVFEATLPVVAPPNRNYTWLGATGNWNDGFQWTPAGVPGALDTAIVSGGTVILNAEAVVSNLVMTGGEIRGTGTLSIQDRFAWSGGSLRSNGTTIVETGAALEINPVVSVALRNGRTLINQGVANWRSGNIDSDLLNSTFVNHGTIIAHANSSYLFGKLVVKPGATFRHQAPGTISMSSSTFNNHGVVEVLSGRLNLNAGNTVMAVDSGFYALSPGTFLRFSGGVRDMKNEASIVGARATVEILPGANLTFSGQYSVDTTIFLGGTTTINAVTNFPVLHLRGGAVLQGSGNWSVGKLLRWDWGTLAGTAATTLLPAAVTTVDGLGAWLAGDHILTNQGSIFWKTGSLAAQQNGAFINEGLLEVTGNQSSMLGTFTNRADGILRIKDSVSVAINNTAFNNHGLVELESGTLNLNTGGGAAASIDSGRYELRPTSTLAFTGGQEHTLATTASISGEGAVQFVVGVSRVINNAVISPGADLGILSVTGIYPQSDEGNLNIEIGGNQAGTEYDRLDISGVAELGGSLNIYWVNSFIPLAGDTFTVITHNGLDGRFATVNAADGAVVDTNYFADRIEIVVIEPPLPTAIDSIMHVPTTFLLKQNYPNPFNPQTTIEYHLPEASMVLLEIFDILGRIVLSRRAMSQPGVHRYVWNGSDPNGNLVSSGVYFYRLETNHGFIQVRKMLLMK